MPELFDIDRERELLIKAKAGDLQAKETLHKEIYARLLNDIAYKVSSSTGQPYIAARLQAEELLDRYMQSWSPTMTSNKPSSYLYESIEKKLGRWAHDRMNPVRNTEHYGLDTGKFNSSVAELSRTLERKPSDTEIMHHMNKAYPGKNYNLENIRRLRDSVRPMVLTSTTIGADEDRGSLTVEDLAFSSSIDEDDVMDKYMQTVKVRDKMRIINTFPEPKRSVALHYFGAPGYPLMNSYRSLALKFGMSKHRIQSLINEAKEELGD